MSVGYRTWVYKAKGHRTIPAIEQRQTLVIIQVAIGSAGGFSVIKVMVRSRNAKLDKRGYQRSMAVQEMCAVNQVKDVWRTEIGSAPEIRMTCCGLRRPTGCI